MSLPSPTHNWCTLWSIHEAGTKRKERKMDEGSQGGEDAGRRRGRSVWDSFRGVGKRLKKFFRSKEEEIDRLRQAIRERDEAIREKDDFNHIRNSCTQFELVYGLLNASHKRDESVSTSRRENGQSSNDNNQEVSKEGVNSGERSSTNMQEIEESSVKKKSRPLVKGWMVWSVFLFMTITALGKSVKTMILVQKLLVRLRKFGNNWQTITLFS